MLKPWVACAAFVVLAGSVGSWITATAEGQAGQAAATCSCGCGGTTRPACAHSCKGNPCTGGAMTNSRIIVGEIVENQPATFSVVAGNGAVLTGFVVEFDNKQTVTTDGQGRGAITPANRRSLNASIDGVTATEVRVISAQQASQAPSRVPRFVTAGNETSVTRAGLFDGHAENTQASIGTTLCPVLFEAPHQVIVKVPSGTPLGPSQLHIADRGQALEQPITVIGFSMQADKMQLAKDETTPGRVIVERADSSLVGGVIRLQNVSTEIISLQLVGSGGTDILERRIDANMIKGGRIELPMTIRGRRGGSFSIVGQVFDPQALTAATCSCGCKGTPRPACAHSCGGNPCTGASIRR